MTQMDCLLHDDKALAGQDPLTLARPRAGVVAVRNDHAKPSHTLAVSDCIVSEGDAGTRTCVFEVTLTPVAP